jgi:hypothetical protein
MPSVVREKLDIAPRQLPFGFEDEECAPAG